MFLTIFLCALSIAVACCAEQLCRIWYKELQEQRIPSGIYVTILHILLNFMAGWIAAIGCSFLVSATGTVPDNGITVSETELFLCFAVFCFFFAALKATVPAICKKIFYRLQKFIAEKGYPEEEREEEHATKAVCSSLWTILRQILLVLGVALLAEFLLFNFRSFMPLIYKETAAYQTYLPHEITVCNGASVSADGNCLIVAEDHAVITIDQLDTQVVSVKLRTNNTPEVFRVKCGITDDAYSDIRWVGPQTVHQGADASRYISVVSHGNMQTLHIEFYSGVKDLQVYEITLNEARPFHLSWLRVAVIAFGGSIIALIFGLQAWKISFDNQNRTQKILFSIAVVFVSVLCIVIFFTSVSAEALRDGTAFFTEYSGEAGCTHDINDAYVQQLDAFLKGQLHLDLDAGSVEPDRLINPYDPAERASAGIHFHFDRAYFNGKYYSYFGLTPLLVYAPLYFLTGSMPTGLLVGMIFGVLCAIAVGFMVWGSVRLFFSGKKISFLLVLFGYLAVIGVGTLLFCVRSANFYYIAPMSAMTFYALFWALHCFACTTTSKRKYQQMWLFFFSGLSFVLCVASRANWALYGFIALPVLVKEFLSEKANVFKPHAGAKLLCFSAFTFPILCGATLLMLHNQLRFGSPFDFGAAYQLTVSDINYNRFGAMENIIPSVYHYFLQPMTLHGYFPFIYPYSHYQLLEQNYYYNCPSIGVFSYPYILPSLLLWLFGCKTSSRLFRHTTALLFFLVLLMAYFNFSMAGSLLRYTADITLILGLCALLCALEATSAGKGLSAFSCKRSVLILCLLMATTFICAVLLSVTGEYGNFLKFRPTLYLNLRHTFEWWY